VGGAPDRVPHRSGPGRPPHRPGRLAAGLGCPADAADDPAPSRVAARRRDPGRPGPCRRAPAGLRRSGRGRVPARSMSGLPKTAAVLGGGAVGQVLVPALNRAGVRVVLPWNRSEQRGWETDLGGIGSPELIFLTVGDGAIEEVCRRIAPLLRRGQVVGHCAGALGLAPLDPALQAGARTGSLHPLRAVPRGSPPGILRDATAGVAGSDAAARETLQQVARALGMSPVPVGDGSRPLYHAAAVLAAGGEVALFARAVQAFQDATGAPEPLAPAALLPLPPRPPDPP